MFILRLFNARFIALGVLALAFASVTYGYAAANTVPAGNAGDGASSISGYTVANPKYNLNATNPGNIDSVEFNVSGNSRPNTVRVKLVSSGTTWYSSCTTGSTASPWLFTCATTSPQATVATADELRVVAVN